MPVPRQPDGSVDLAAFNAMERRRQKAAQVDGLHYSAHAPTVKQLMREKRHEEAAGLLLRLVAAVEREQQADPDWALPPFYHRQLGAAYRKLGRHDLAEKTKAAFQALEVAKHRRQLPSEG